MIYPKNSIQKLGFNQIIYWTKEYCSSILGENLIEKITFLKDKKKIAHQLQMVGELKQILESDAFNLQMNIDIDLKEKMASKQGFYYKEEDLEAMLAFFRNVEETLDFIGFKHAQYPTVSKLFNRIDIPERLSNIVDKILDVDGQIKSDASKELAAISKKIGAEKKRLTSRSLAIFENSKNAGYTAETELTIKDGRVVIPILSEHKRKIPGILVDQSGSGKVSYIEPSELVEINYVLAELHIQRRQEVIKILKACTKKIVPHLKMLLLMQKKLALFDFIRAKAQVAIQFGGIVPDIDENEIVLIGALNPLLVHRLKEEKSTDVAIPLSLTLNPTQKIIVISGPNAGGKSVAMKTLGLLQLMLQHGFLIPSAPGTKMRIFQQVFSDIGDNQSIESDLSTYSSHLKSAKHIVNFSDENTMVLMDEIGTGTDPQLGGALAEAVLETIHSNGVYGIVTTHFGNIKVCADKLSHTINAAMLFDLKNLKPLYKLEIGQAGSSFTFEVAQKIGLNKKIIQKARSYVETKQYDYDKLLTEVQQKKENLEKEISIARDIQKDAIYWQKEYKELKKKIDSLRNEMIAQARTEANEIVAKANQKIEQAIRNIKENQADKAKTKRIRQDLNSWKQDLNESNKVAESKKVTTLFKEGDRVQLVGSSTVGEILKIKNNKVELKMGGLTTKTNIENIQKVGAASKKEVTKYVSSSKFNSISQNFNPELDVRGFRTLEALEEVDKWMDQALILGFKHGRILHGIGNGILRNQIRTHLKKNGLIEEMSDGDKLEGGKGITKIAFK